METKPNDPLSDLIQMQKKALAVIGITFFICGGVLYWNGLDNTTRIIGGALGSCGVVLLINFGAM